MVIQKAVDNLKGRPKDEKKVVAGGIAIAVIGVLLFAWAILFLKKIQSGTQDLEFVSGAQDAFLSETVREAQQSLQDSFSNIDELEAIREQSASNQSGDEGTVQLSGQDGGGTDPFESPSTGY